MLTRRLTVIFDIDDVLIPLASEIHKAIGEAGLNPDNKPMTTWEMWLDYGCTKDQWIEVFSGLAVPDGIYHAPPYPGVRSALKVLEEDGHDIHLVTARGFHNHADLIRQWTREWKEIYRIPGTLHFSHRKGETAMDLEATHAIDDAIHNVRDLQAAGAESYLLNRPHNAKDYWSPSRRVDGVWEFVRRITDG